MLRKLSLAVLLPLCMLTLYLVLVIGEYLFESDQVRAELAQRQSALIKQQLFRMQNVVQSAQALQDVERIEQEVSLAALDMGTMVYILVDAESRIRFANHTVWRDSNATQVIDGYDVDLHRSVVQAFFPQILVNLDRLTIQAYYPVLPQYGGAVDLIYLEADLAPLVAEASAKLQQRFMRVWGLGGLLLIGFTFILYFLLIRPFQMLSEAAKQVGTSSFSTSIPWSSSEVLSLQASLQQAHERLSRAVKQLNDSELRWLFAVEGSRNGIWDWDISTGEVFLSDRWKEMIGYAPDELAGVFQTWETRLHPDDKQIVLDALQEYVSGKSKEFESVHRLRHRDGHYVWVLDRGMLVDWDPQGRPTRMIGIHMDVSESAKNHAAITELVDQSVVGRKMLPDVFMVRLSQFLTQGNSSGQWGALLLVEVDRLGLVATLHSHELERLLTQIAARLSSYFTENITVGRLESGNFVLLAKDLAADASAAARRALALASELRQVIARPFHYGHHHFELSACVGICLLDSIETLEPALVMRRAELATLSAKQAGQAGCAFYHAEMDFRQSRDELLQQELQTALQQDSLTLMFQPVINATSELVSAEVLTRWYRADGEFIPPAEFVALAEQGGIIAELDLWVAKRVCLFIQKSRAQGRSLPPLTLNISAFSFGQADFVDTFVGLVKEHGIGANQLGIELNEAAFLMQPQFVDERVSKLVEVGVGIILDHFGSGLSALSCLANQPLVAVKLDMSCIDSLTTMPTKVNVLITSARQFNLSVVAKGVESSQQYQAFVELGCDGYQGYLFSRALNQADFIQLVCPRPLLRSV
ncbi:MULTISPECIES: GGDEF domain-containing phosphodiesterase [unclassified Shewanella]|uniref:GGDEF domain-containing phosphodiesterase n=1 Tax=Shewanella TaxID=22 RepID=UPI0021DAB31B|nr:MULTISPECIES: GGDEF domain-containing phosphodiesterase [unclassified Shewanella]MCU8022627.1 EAL domain-containing protein [Shewanella sp. SM78]MCU8043872.1 EAL domain-containing protein [Shewanella sp. SM68]MCU8047955.1 EAL domain-containing protein [Shewanella sp. SM65]MCU8079689.1 EAL domain-containing protein [Shewanella sp. SM103]